MNRMERKRRLERAGFVPLPQGWVKPAFAQRVQAQLDAYAKDIAEILAEPPKPRGRPKKP